tara:strand:+ start:1802 stop:2362 length:561 start_codon:yes stop_codon:yes gene_type:complete
MRIISGKLKGKKLFLPKDKSTRPLKDLVKVSIFNLLDHSKKINKKLENSSILDLFSGSGSFGLECLSRGSKNVYFFENYIEAIKVLEKNLSFFKDKKNFKIFKNDCFEFFNSNQKVDKKFDIIFLDPPYKETRINRLIEKIIENKILNPDGVIIIHRHKRDKIEITNKIKIFDVRNYGLSKIYFGN